MGCSSKITRSQYEQLISDIQKSILEIMMCINIYKQIEEHCENHHKDIMKSIIIDKSYHLKILQETYALISNESTNIVSKNTLLDRPHMSYHIDNSIKREFEYINILKRLRISIPDENLKHAINVILIDQNNIINKLIYIKCKKS